MTTTPDEPIIALLLNPRKSSISQSPAVLHPFLVDYSSGGIRRQKDTVIFSEFYFFIYRLPYYMAGLIARSLDDSVLEAMSRILAEEMGYNLDKPGTHERPHLQLYREFLASLGVGQDQLLRYEPAPATKRLDSEIMRLYTQEPTAMALGALFALETVSDDMVSRLHSGLQRRHYAGVSLKYFELHMLLEKYHAKSAFSVSGPIIRAGPVELEQFDKGIADMIKCLAAFWDGVAALCGPRRR